MAGTARTRAQLTTDPGAPFRTGNVPTNADFQNLAASHFNLLDDDASRITVDPVSQDFLEAELGVLPREAGGVRALLAGVVNKIVSLLPFTVRTVDTIAALRALPGDTRRAVYVRGYWAPGDDGGGMFQFDQSRVAEDDGGLCIGGWVRVRNGMVITPLMFGADKTGNIDSTSALQRAINAANSGAGGVYIPHGVYKHTGLTISWTGSSLRIFGDQYNSQSGSGSELLYAGTGGAALTFFGAGAEYNGYVIDMLHLTSADPVDAWAIKFDQCAHVRVTNSYVKGFGNSSGGGILCTGTYDSVNQTEWVDVYNVVFHNCFDGLFSDTTDCNSFNVEGCFFYSIHGLSIRGDNGGGSHIFGFQRWNIVKNRFYSNTENGFIKFSGGARGLSVIENYFENNLNYCACLFVNGPLKSTAIEFSYNNVNASPVVDGGVVEIGYCDGLVVNGNTFTKNAVDTIAMVKFLTGSPFGVVNYSICLPNLPVGASIKNTLRDFSGSVYTNKLVEDYVNVFLRTNVSLSQNPTTGWGLSICNHGVMDIASSAVLDLAAGEGIVLLHSDTTGKAAAFLCYGANSVKIAGDSSIVSGVPASGQIGLRYNNTTGKFCVENKQVFSEYIYLSMIKTRG